MAALSNTTHATPPNNPPIDAAYGYLILLFIPAMTILGNILVMLAVLGDKQLKKSVTNRYIAALAFSDFLVGVIPMPLAVYVKVNGEQWNLGVGMCKFYVACDVTSSTASILHLLVISADRYLAISWPAEYQRYARKAKITFAIVLVWLISITLSIPVVMGKSILDTEACWLDNPEYMIYSSLLSFYIPAGVLTLVYVKIFRKIRVRQGIRAMLRAGGEACGADVGPFHLPFVVVQEVSFDDQLSSTEKRLSDCVSASGPVAGVNKPKTAFPKETRSTAGNGDGLGCYRLLKTTEEVPDGPTQPISRLVTSLVSKSRTFPIALADETETILPANDLYDRNTKTSRGLSLVPEVRNRSHTDGNMDLVASKSRFGKVQGRCNGDDVRLLCRTSSEKRANDHKDRAVQTRHHRRLSLWYHHSCQHIGTITENGTCFVVEGEEEEDEIPVQLPKRRAATVRHRIFTKALGSSAVSLKQVTRIQNKTRRTSSLELNSAEPPTPPPINGQAPARNAHVGVSVSTSLDFDAEIFDSCKRSGSGQADDEEEEDNIATVYALPGTGNKNKTGFNLKKLANRVTNALHRITETQAVTKEKKATKLVALILGIFVISWLPFFTFNTMRGICLSAGSSPSACDWLNSQVFFLTSWLGYANSSFNPIIYALVNQHFRRTYKRLLGWPLKSRT